MDDDRMDDQLRRDAGMSDHDVPDSATPADQTQGRTEQAIEQMRDDVDVDRSDDDPGAPEDRIGLPSQERLAEMATRRGTRA